MPIELRAIPPSLLFGKKDSTSHQCSNLKICAGGGNHFPTGNPGQETGCRAYVSYIQLMYSMASLFVLLQMGRLGNIEKFSGLPEVTSAQEIENELVSLWMQRRMTTIC